MSEPGKSNGLTIAELFPDGDAIAQWVFIVTALAEDLMFAVEPTKQAMANGDLRAMLYYQRQVVSRLYDARRLVMSGDKTPELQSFVGPLLSAPGLTDLRSVYVRQPGAKESVVESLYTDIRNRSVHYARVGSDELIAILRDHGRFPARLHYEMRENESPKVWFQWVDIVRGLDLFGGIGQTDLLAGARERTQLAGNISATWMMVAAMAVLTNARRLGIDPNRLGDWPAGFGS